MVLFVFCMPREKGGLRRRLLSHRDFCVCHSTSACDGNSSKTRVGLYLSIPVVGACVGENTHSSCYVSAGDLSLRRVGSLTPTSMQCCELHTRHFSSASLWIQSSCKVRELLYVRCDAVGNFAIPPWVRSLQMRSPQFRVI